MMLREHRCIRCGACLEACPRGAITQADGSVLTDLDKCIACGTCVRVCHAEAREAIGRKMTVAQVMAEVEKDIVFYDQSGGGVTFSGGEPLLQAEFLDALLVACKEKEIHTAVDTSGFAHWPILERIRGKVDLFLYDLKIMDSTRHREYTGVPNEMILTNVSNLAALGSAVRIRVPIIPGINDDDENILKLGEFLCSLDRPLPVSVLPYHKAGIHKYARLHKTYTLTDVESPSEERMNEIATALRRHGIQVQVGG